MKTNGAREHGLEIPLAMCCIRGCSEAATHDLATLCNVVPLCRTHAVTWLESTEARRAESIIAAWKRKVEAELAHGAKPGDVQE